MSFGLMQHLDVAICQNAKEAVAKGYNYPREAGFKAVEITKVVVIREGTENKNPTVDFVLQDVEGNKFVVMVTGNLLKSIPC